MPTCTILQCPPAREFKVLGQYSSTHMLTIKYSRGDPRVQNVGSTYVGPVVEDPYLWLLKGGMHREKTSQELLY